MGKRNNKIFMLRVRMSNEEHKNLKRKARRAKKSMSRFVRDLAQQAA
jgi:predicted HicB family RNase H-like nuclease